MDYHDLLYGVRDGIATITLNRPARLNALGPRTGPELAMALSQAASDEAVRVIVLTGAGKAFCSGGDQKDVFAANLTLPQMTKRQRLRQGFVRLVQQMTMLEKPIVAAINGPAIGGGCTLAMACDLRVASSAATFGLVFSKIAVTPEYGSSYLLPRLVGLGRALELLLLGETIGGDEALRAGLVNRVVPPADLASAVRNLALQLAERSPTTLGIAKTLMYRGLSMDLAAALEMEAFALSAAFHAPEHHTAVQTFLARKERKATAPTST